MPEKRTMVCIICPVGCNIEVCMDDKKICSISGNSCKRGADYVLAECTNPSRTLTSVMRVIGAQSAMIPVKSDKPVPKELLFECMKEINGHQIHAPVKMGEVVIENILNTGVDIIATRSIQ